MSASDVLHPDGTDYDAFLHAEVGEDRTGAAVTVLSALARLGLEPWTEAKALARLGKEDAELRLNAHFETIKDIPALALASQSRASRLVSLLPRRAPPIFAKEPQSGRHSFPQIPVIWVMLAIIGCAMIAQILNLAQPG